MSFFLSPSCIDCGTKRNLSRYITSFFWICPYCSKRRTIELLQEFLLKEGFSKKERVGMRQLIAKKQKELSEMAKDPVHEKAVQHHKLWKAYKQME